MKRMALLAGLIALSAPAHADGFSFSVGGHRVHIAASRHCRSTSCASVSVSGIYDSSNQRDRFGDDEVQPAKPAFPASQDVLPPAPPKAPATPTVVVSVPSVVYKPASTGTQAVAAPPPPPVQQAAIPASLPPPVQKIAVPLPLPVAAPSVSRVSHEGEQETDTPVGDW